MKFCEVSDAFSGTWVSEGAGEDNGILKDILLCGPVSRNGRKYTEASFGGRENVQALYEGSQVFLDHPKDRSDPRNRTVKDLAGVVVKARYTEAGVRGDVQPLETAAGATLKALHKARPRKVGMSHVVLAEQDKKTSNMLVKEVLSVDVVINPATTKTFSEKTMDNEALVQELAQVRTERDAIKAQVVSFESEAKGQSEKIAGLVTENSKLSADLKAAQDKLAVFEAKEAAERHRQAILAEIAEAGLKAGDISESLMAVLADLDADKRKTLIQEKVEMLKQPALGAIERQKPKSGNDKPSFDSGAYLAQFGLNSKE